PHLSQTYAMTYPPEKTGYFLIAISEGGVICGGANYTFEDGKSLWSGNFDGSTLIQDPRPAIRKHFETIMQDDFWGWEGSGTSQDRIWTENDGCPHVGQVPEHSSHFALAGFNVLGMFMTFLTAKGIAKMVRENVPLENAACR
ncbi:hypothetical protein BJ878DRAFT_430108, partial [Calycina marina]